MVKNKSFLYGYRLIVHIKRDDICKSIAEDVETKCDTLNYELNRPLEKGKNKKVIGVMKDELGENIMKEFFGLRAKTYSYLDNSSEDKKKIKGTKRCIIKKN